MYINVKGRGGKRRRILSKKARAYKQEVGWKLKKYAGNQFDGEVAVDMDYYPPHNRRFDVMNFNKAILDCMSGVLYKDDSFIVDIRQRKHKPIDKAGRVVIRVREALCTTPKRN